MLRILSFAIVAVITSTALLLGTSACTSLGAPKSSIDVPFNDLIEARTVKIIRYSGVTNIYQLHATLLSTDVTNAQIDVLARDYEWTHDKMIQERQRTSQEASSQTQVFLDFYLPDSSLDDLLNPNSIWRLFLDCGTKRYEGHVTRMKRPFAELLSIFPYHNKWVTPYVISFAVPLAEAEQSKVVFTVTGPVGSEAIVFDHGKAITN